MTMSPRQYLTALKELGLTVASQRTAKLLCINVRQSQRYASGHATVPETVERLLLMYKKHGTNEHRKVVRCGGESVEAIQIDGTLWDTSFPWGTERVVSEEDDLVATVRARFKRKMETLNG